MTCTGKLPLARPQYRRTLCGRWEVDERRLEVATEGMEHTPFTLDSLSILRDMAVVKPPSLRYRDPPSVLELIQLRKNSTDSSERAGLVKRIHEARLQAKADHETNPLLKAQQGDRTAIGFLKRSSCTSATDARFLQRAGGATSAIEQVESFYRSKYQAKDSTPLELVVGKLRSKHKEAQLRPISFQKILTHLSKL